MNSMIKTSKKLDKTVVITLRRRLSRMEGTSIRKFIMKTATDPFISGWKEVPAE